MIPFVLNDISQATSYLKYGFLVAVLLVTLVMSVRFLVQRRWEWKSFLLWVLLLTYGIVLIQVALLSREPGSRTAMDLVPFSTWGLTDQSHAYVIENVIMFLPMGCLLPLAGKIFRSFWVLFGTVLVMSLSIETTQYITERGYLQTDDVITNVLGGVLGFGLYCVLRGIFSKVLGKTSS